jgi:hypothetical protein
VSRLHNSPLGAELDAAREQGTLEVVRLARRRHAPVRATVLPGATRALAVLCAEGEMADWMDMEVDRG